MKNILLLTLLLASGDLFAAATRTLDGAQITNSGATLVLPTASDTLVGRGTTDTLTNKTLTAPAITSPTGIVKGDVGLGNVDNTSDATKNSATATLTNKTISGSTNTLSAIPAATALTGQVPLANGGTGASTQAGAANAVLPAQSTNNGKYLTTDGTNASWNTIPASQPTVTGSQSSPTSVTAAGGVAFTGSNYFNVSFVQGSAGAVTVSASPQIAAGTLVGQRLMLVGTSASNTLSLVDGTGLGLNGPVTISNNSAIEMVWNGSVWYETSRR
jgi:hypothetical protein